MKFQHEAIDSEQTDDQIDLLVSPLTAYQPKRDGRFAYIPKSTASTL